MTAEVAFKDGRANKRQKLEVRFFTSATIEPPRDEPVQITLTGDIEEKAVYQNINLTLDECYQLGTQLIDYYNKYKVKEPE